MTDFDAIVIGAGAAGMYCAAQAGRRGLKVALVDHWPKLAEKIRISGGGRCNFTNLQADRLERYSGEDANFARNALRALPPARFVEQVRRRGIDYHEKHKGQLFCDDSAERIIAMLREDCDGAGVRWFRPVAVHAVERAGSGSASIRRAASPLNCGMLADVDASTSPTMPRGLRHMYSTESQPPHDCPSRWQRSRPSALRTWSTSSTERSSVHSDGSSGLSDRPQPSWS